MYIIIIPVCVIFIIITVHYIGMGIELFFKTFQIHPSDVVGPKRRGRGVVICGDSCDSSALCAAVGSTVIDVLVHEATMENKTQDNAIQYGHSTAGNT